MGSLPLLTPSKSLEIRPSAFFFWEIEMADVLDYAQLLGKCACGSPTLLESKIAPGAHFVIFRVVCSGCCIHTAWHTYVQQAINQWRTYPDSLRKDE